MTSRALNKVGIITGGASGMGLEVAKLLSFKGWNLHLYDFNQKAGIAATKQVPNSTFHHVDVTQYRSLASAFDRTYRESGSTIDFVFANAGIVERDNFYAKVDERPPPEPNQASIDINLKGVVNTTYLAQHYFRSSPHGGKNKALVMTASCGAFVSRQIHLASSSLTEI
jgi:NAD(P)-dependent dehydrogenase (short-subunit alcohol dehydrogenase family)